jgi:hypothetical protein
MFDIIIVIFARLFSDSYRFIDQYFITNILTFVRGFEVAIFLVAAVIFFLIAVGITMRQLRRLPKSYSIEILDLDGRRATIDGLRQAFSTYGAAESYARYYQQTYHSQYTFKVVGSTERIEYKIEKA